MCLRFGHLPEEFDERIQKKFKMANRGYDGSKPNPQDWADLFDNDPLFDEEFRKVHNNMDIPKAEDVEFTPETMDDTYLLRRGSGGPTSVELFLLVASQEQWPRGAHRYSLNHSSGSFLY